MKIFPPAYFALVMTTGMLSMAASSLGFRMSAIILMYVNSVAYLILLCMTVIRLICYFPNLLSDFTSHKKGPGFFTFVAATCIFGSQLINIVQMNRIGLFFWFFGLILWFIVMYGFFFAAMTRKNKPKLKDGINGAWLIAAVATQSLSVLGTTLASYITEEKTILLFFSLCLYFLGCMLYLNIIALIFYRLTFLKLESSAIIPPYWINMGAVAIATLAGSILILQSRYLTLLDELVPFIKGFTLFFWITGSWWIPLLLILMIWRLVYHRIRIQYNAQYWAMAFPLAMYTLSTTKLAQALKLPFLYVIPNFFIYVALAVWILGAGLFFYHISTLLKQEYQRK